MSVLPSCFSLRVTGESCLESHFFGKIVVQLPSPSLALRESRGKLPVTLLLFSCPIWWLLLELLWWVNEYWTTYLSQGVKVVTAEELEEYSELIAFTEKTRFVSLLPQGKKDMKQCSHCWLFPCALLPQSAYFMVFIPFQGTTDEMWSSVGDIMISQPCCHFHHVM